MPTASPLPSPSHPSSSVRAGPDDPAPQTGQALPEAATDLGRHDRYRMATRAGQLGEVLELTPYLAVTHALTAAMVTFFFWGYVPRAYLLGLFTLVVLPTTVAVIGRRHYRSRPAGAAQIDAGHRAAAALTLLLGLAWGTMPLALYSLYDTQQRLFVVAVCTGLIATTFVIGPIRYLAPLFAIPVVAGSFAALMMDHESIGRTLAILLAIYTAFVLFCSSRMAGLSIERIIDRVRVSEQNETISLLLHDFEENTSDWLWETGPDGRLQHVSERIAQVSGQSLESLREAPFTALFGRSMPGRPAATDVAELVALVAEHKAFRDRAVEVTIGDAVRWWRLSGKPVYDKAEHFIGFRGVGSDITATRQSEARIAYLASYDSITGLANRALFQDVASMECDRALWSGRPCAMLYLDLDGFKLVNDSFGHALGDALLVRVAQRLTDSVPSGVLVSRLGGDEFAVLTTCADEAEAIGLARTLIAKISAPYNLDGVQVEIGVSIGLAMAPRDAETPESLLGRADLALYRAKANGRGKVSVFTVDLEASVRNRRDLETDLKRAVAQDEFTLHYQPLIGLADGRIHAFEALLRWNRSAGGPVSPAEFVPVAEATGLIAVIGRWVLHQACAEAARWPDHIRIAVNISPIQFRNSDLVIDVMEALHASGLKPDRLELEVTESVFFEMNATTIANLKDLRALGIRIALDDFGTGYSSLSYLIRFPVDKIKIDRSFVKEMGTRPECLAIIEAILTLARKLSITVTAEGVETVEQALMLKASRCDDIQGFLFSPGRPAEEIGGLIDTLPHRFRATFPPTVFSPPVFSSVFMPVVENAA